MPPPHSVAKSEHEITGSATLDAFGHNAITFPRAAITNIEISLNSFSHGTVLRLFAVGDAHRVA